MLDLGIRPNRAIAHENADFSFFTLTATVIIVGDEDDSDVDTYLGGYVFGRARW